MNKITRVMMVAIASMSFAMAYPQDAFNQVIKTIIDNNPELQNQVSMAHAQALESADENTLSNPEVSFARVWGRRGVGNKLQLDVSQSFDWPGLYRARSQANKHNYTVAQMEAAASTLETAIEAKNLLLELVFVRQQLKYWHDLDVVMENMVAVSQQALNDGEINKLDFKKISIEDYKVHAQINQIKSREDELITEIQSLCPGIELDLSAITEYPLMPLLAETEYLEQISQLDPGLMATLSAKEQASMEARAATMSRMPSFSVGYQHQAEMGDRFNGFTVGMLLPFFANRNSKKAAMERANILAVTTTADQERLEDKTKQTYKILGIWQNDIQAYETIFGDNEYLRLLDVAYKGGEINILELFQETNYYNEMTMAYLEAQYSYNMALAWLNRYSIMQ